ncbi:unnamed protein product [Rhodiola kirilowii]
MNVSFTCLARASSMSVLCLRLHQVRRKKKSNLLLRPQISSSPTSISNLTAFTSLCRRFPVASQSRRDPLSVLAAGWRGAF